MAQLTLVEGDLLDQPVEVIVNAWNRNLIPWWLLLPQGVSGAIKRRAGFDPFRELSKQGPLPAGGAARTGSGRLPFKAIIHVAGLDFLWRSNEKIIRQCVENALALAQESGFSSVAFPVIGSGTGGVPVEKAIAAMTDAVENSPYSGQVIIVRFKPSRT